MFLKEHPVQNCEMIGVIFILSIYRSLTSKGPLEEYDPIISKFSSRKTTEPKGFARRLISSKRPSCLKSGSMDEGREMALPAGVMCDLAPR